MLKSFSFALLRTPLQSLKNAYGHPTNISKIFQEGLYLSSPDFLKEFEKKEKLKTKEKEKLKLSLTKYILRSSVRCTPYGTFAGSTVVNIQNDATDLILNSNEGHRRSLRLDMNYMTEIVNALVQIPGIREQLLFIPNNSMYAVANVYRYAEYYISNNKRNYQLSAVDKSPYLEKILLKANQGASLKELSSILVADDDGDEEEAIEYITELYRSQLLIPTIEPAVTGIEPLDHVIFQLEQLTGTGEILASLKEIQYLLLHPVAGVDFYKEIEEKLGSLALGITVPKNTIQADLFLDAKTTKLNTELVNAIVNQLEDLKVFAKQNKTSELEDFKQKFHKRYEEKEMPLALVLDADLGIGYAGISDQSAGSGEFIDGLAVASSSGSPTGKPLDYLQKFSLLKYNEWLTENTSFIEIKEEDIQAFKENIRGFSFPDSMYAKGSLLKLNSQLDKDHFAFDVQAFGGPSAANLLGRFAHGDEKLSQLTKEVLEQEEKGNPEAIYAEVAHLPQARIGNILLRPVFRKYEIPYVGFSGIKSEQQITIDDLFVSIKKNEVVLFSKKLNKRIIPRLTTAHNYGSNSLPFYKFLCDLQNQGIAFPNAWDWGHLTVFKHLPRVVYKNLVVRKAFWKIEKKDITELPKNPAEYRDYFVNFRAKLKMPQRVVYVEGDNDLLIDFEERMGIELFLHYLNKYKNITLEEFLFTEENCIVFDEAGNPFTNELIVPLYDDEMAQQTQTGANSNVAVDNEPPIKPEVGDGKTQHTVTRSFSPYSQWLYFKIYCGAKSIEKILAKAVLPFIETAIAENVFERFFFVRYRDDAGGHFRIRFYNSNSADQLLVYQKFMQTMQPFLDNGTVEKILIDSYHRELERYTPELIEAAEVLFYHDSLAILRFLDLLDGIDGEKYRMLFALRGIDILLNDFGFTMEEKGALVKNMQAAFFKEFGGHTSLQKQLNDRYRKYQSFLVSHLNPENDEENDIQDAVDLFQIRSEMNIPVVRNISDHFKATGSPQKISEFLVSIIHMYLNRLFIAQQRKYELVTYHFLERYYTSRIAIAKKELKHGIPVL